MKKSCGVRPMVRPYLTSLRFFLPCFICIVTAGCMVAAGQTNDYDQNLAQQVFQRLLATVPPPADMPWPPKLEIIDKEEINAFASQKKNGQGTDYPIVVCYSGVLKHVVEGNPDRLAFILGHELGHHLLGHTNAPKGATAFLQTTFTREQEISADQKGMELALRAGYSYQGGLSAIHKFLDLGLNYSSFEGLGYDHPSWVDRIAILDKDQASLWRSMSSFDNGVYFLLVQNYPLAERAFRQVTKEFPSSYDAWANLGYALLMQYADSLDTEDLRHFDVGQIVAGGFYRRPKSLESQVRGVNEEMWWDAVGALREAIRLKPDLSLPKANLGIAYLLRPAGKDPGKAAQLLEEASEQAEKDTSLDPISRLAEQINLAVAYQSEGSGDKAMTALDQVETSLRENSSGLQRASSPLSSALNYNRAILLASSSDNHKQRLAMDELEDYLQHTGSALAWWPLAYQRYVALCKEFGVAPKSQEALLSQAAPHFRPVAALDINSAQIALGDSFQQAKLKLGETSSAIPVVYGTNLTLLDYPHRGIKLLGTEEVLAIFLSGSSAPPLNIREMGLGAKVTTLKVGMSNAELDRAMGDADYDFRQLLDPNLNYRFYPDIGIAILSENGNVTELVIGQIPKQRIGL
jgi:Peptidase family M48